MYGGWNFWHNPGNQKSAGIHGVVLVPVGEKTDIGFLKERTAEFLRQKRNEADWLSGHLYRYIAKRDVIEEVLS